MIIRKSLLHEFGSVASFGGTSERSTKIFFPPNFPRKFPDIQCVLSLVYKSFDECIHRSRTHTCGKLFKKEVFQQ